MKNIAEYSGLIYKSAWGAARACGLLDEIDDVLQEAWVGACEALRRYNPEKAAVSTHLANAVYFRILKYYARRQVLPLLPENYDAATNDIGRQEWVLFWESLSDREREMASYAMRPNTGKRTAIVQHFARIWGHMTANAVAGGLRQKLATA